MPRALEPGGGFAGSPGACRRGDWLRLDIPGLGGRGDDPREVVEAALAHFVQNEVEAAYGPSDVVERRRQLMDDWFPYVVDGTGSAA